MKAQVRVKAKEVARYCRDLERHRANSPLLETYIIQSWARLFTAAGGKQAANGPGITDPKTPNVLFIVIDDLRYDGPWLADAPHFRSLLSEGTAEGDNGQWYRSVYHTVVGSACTYRRLWPLLPTLLPYLLIIRRPCTGLTMRMRHGRCVDPRVRHF